ncbi:MAG: hypothetical protein K2W94_04235 [Alphaproteobacteria bacterium]|nr:hypothetical protein [Alphaproteobacteria bacterium]
MSQLGTPFDLTEDVKRLWNARTVEARVAMTAQSLEGEDLNHPPFAKIWQIPYFDSATGKAINHEDFVNVLITMADLKVKSGASDADISLAFLQEGKMYKAATRRLWKNALEAHDRFLEREQATFSREYAEAQEEKTLPMAHRVLRFVSNACVKFPGDEVRVKMASKLIATGGVFGFRSKKLDVKEAATLVTACEKVAKGYVQNFMGQTKMPVIEGLDMIDDHLIGLQNSLEQVDELMRSVRLEFNVLGPKDEEPELEPIKQGYEEIKKGLLAERVALETEAEQKHFIQTFKSALVPLKDIFFSEGLPLRMPTTVTTNRILNHQRTCTVISMFYVMKSLEKKSLDALNRVLPTVTAPSVSTEDRIFNYIDEIFASADGAVLAKTSRQLFTSACRHLEPDFEFSFGGRARNYLGGSGRVSSGVHSDSDD